MIFVLRKQRNNVFIYSVSRVSVIIYVSIAFNPCRALRVSAANVFHDRSTILIRPYPTYNTCYLNLFLVAIQRLQFQSINIQRDIFLAYTTNVYIHIIYYIVRERKEWKQTVCGLLELHTGIADSTLRREL